MPLSSRNSCAALSPATGPGGGGAPRGARACRAAQAAAGRLAERRGQLHQGAPLAAGDPPVRVPVKAPNLRDENVVKGTFRWRARTRGPVRKIEVVIDGKVRFRAPRAP